MRVRTSVAALVAGGLLIGVPAAGTALAADDVIKTKLTGAAEVPGPGDPNGKGVFRAELGDHTLCYRLRAKKIDHVTGAHIHAGDAHHAGPVVVTLLAPTEHGVAECLVAVPDHDDTDVTLSESELAAIRHHPDQFYVNVHTEHFPHGAIRGQLH